MTKDSITLRMEGFAHTLGRIRRCKNEGKWDDAIQIVGASLGRLLKTSPQKLRYLTETELLAQLTEGAATVWVPYKMTMLIALLKETGDYASMKDPPHGGYRWHLKALHLLLDAFHHHDLAESNELLPSIEVLLAAAEGRELPVRTRLLLMREYERRGWFAKAFLQFQIARELGAGNSRLVRLGTAFCERLLSADDAELAAGNITRQQVRAMLGQLRAEAI